MIFPRKSFERIVDYVLSLLLLLIIWQLFSSFLHKTLLPAPGKVLRELLHLFVTGILLKEFITSTLRVLVSLALALSLAVPLGLFLGRNPGIDRIAAPLIYILYPLPKITFLPLIVVLFGLGNLPKILLIVLIVFFQILVSTRDAAKGIPLQWLLTMKSLHSSTLELYIHLVLPYCLPNIFTSLRVSLGTAIAVLFLAETFASSDGLGYFILDVMGKRNYVEMYAGILAMGLLGVLSYTGIDLMENRYCKWNKKSDY